jgi:hypothetical protein
MVFKIEADSTARPADSRILEVTLQGASISCVRNFFGLCLSSNAYYSRWRLLAAELCAGACRKYKDRFVSCSKEGISGVSVIDGELEMLANVFPICW